MESTLSAEGYKADPLSTEMERRIREHLKRCQETGHLPNMSLASRVIWDAWCNCLEWVLNEAEAVKLEK